MENKEFTPEKSLQIISEAIMKSRRDFEKSAGTPLIIWGSAVVLTALIVWFLWSKTGNPAWNYLWFAMTAIVGPIMLILNKKCTTKSEGIISQTLGQIWNSFGGIAIAIAIIGSLLIPIDITMVIVIILGYAAALTGLVLRNWVITIGGFVMAILAPVALTYLVGSNVMLLMVGAALITLLIPGIILNITNRKR